MDSTSQKYGVVLKCPNCGEPLKAGSAKCACGHEFSGISANATITALSQRFLDIEADVNALGLTGVARKKEVAGRKADAIREQGIPPTREDLRAMVDYILPKAKDSTDPNAEAWRDKLREVLRSAQTAFKGDANTRAEFEEIEKNLKGAFAGSIEAKAKRNPFVAIGVIAVLLIAGLGVVGTQMDKWKLKQCEAKYDEGAAVEKKRLEGILAATDALQKEKKFSDAQVALGKLNWEFQTECKAAAAQEARTMWENKRAEMMALIQKNEVEHNAQQQAIADAQETSKRAEVAKATAQERAVAAQRATSARKAATGGEW